MMKWCSTVTVTIGFALTFGTPAWAQEAAKPDAASGSSLFLLFVMFLPFLIIVIFFLIPVMRRAKQNTTQIDRSLAINEESLRLARERVALQKETNSLLKQLIEKQSRF